MPSRKSKKLEHKILEMPPQKMAVVSGSGTPEKVFYRAHARSVWFCFYP